MLRKISFNIGGSVVAYEVDGETAFGPNVVLLSKDDDLIANTSWSKQGYTNQPLFNEKESNELREELRKQFITVVEKFVHVDSKTFRLEAYHSYVDNLIHKQITAVLRSGFSADLFPGGIGRLEKRISEICGVNLTSVCPSLQRGGYFIRIVRPLVETDNNPPHRDVWLDTLRNCVNIYFPLAGSNELSALPIVPGSHHWSESEIERTAEGAKIQDAVYQVPSVVGWKKSLDLIRPNPKGNEVMVFSPYTIHGGGINLNNDVTRMSLEVRFWRR